MRGQIPAVVRSKHHQRVVPHAIGLESGSDSADVWGGGRKRNFFFCWVRLILHSFLACNTCLKLIIIIITIITIIIIIIIMIIIIIIIIIIITIIITIIIITIIIIIKPNKYKYPIHTLLRTTHHTNLHYLHTHSGQATTAWQSRCVRLSKSSSCCMLQSGSAGPE